MLMSLKRTLGNRMHYVLYMLATSLILLGLLLMNGESSTNDNFCSDIFSAQRIIAAPILCFIGYILFIPAIALTNE